MSRKIAMMTIFEKSSNSDHNCNFIIMAYGSTPYVRMAPKKIQKKQKTKKKKTAATLKVHK